MKNVEMKMEGNVLTIEINLEHEIGPSKSGKTTMIATSEGNQSFATTEGLQFTMGLNVYKYD